MKQVKFFSLCLLLLLMMSQAFAKTDLQNIEQDISDSIITTKITAKFAQHQHLNPFKISVSTENGIVKLSGFVKDSEAFVEALRLAKNTKGVKAVESDALEIKEVNTKLQDAYITAKVEAAVLKAKVLDDESIPLVGIQATTKNGTVVLSGTVKKQKSIAFILKWVNRVKGVKEIISNIEVANT